MHMTGVRHEEEASRDEPGDGDIEEDEAGSWRGQEVNPAIERLETLPGSRQDHLAACANAGRD